jgi:hypothetical protein
LVALEEDVRYQEAARAGEAEFEHMPGRIRILVSAPHGAAHTRNGGYKGEDEYTAGFARLISDETGAHCIYARRKSNTDPNEAKDAPYKDRVREICAEHGIRFVMDIHGMNARRKAGLALGTRRGASCSETQQELMLLSLEKSGFEADQANPLRKLWVNPPRFSGMGSAEREPMVSFVSERLKISAAQFEINAHNRIVQRREDSAEFDKSFQGDPEMIERTVSAFVHLIHALNQHLQG